MQPFSSQIYGLYTSLVYLTPVLGGLIADRWIGQRKAVYIGGIVMAMGHFVMVSEQLFLVALGLLVGFARDEPEARAALQARRRDRAPRPSRCALSRSHDAARARRRRPLPWHPPHHGV